MQTNHLDIYKTLAMEKGTSEQTYKDIGSFIFRETAKMLKEPTSLIIKLKGIGSWHLRKKRMEIFIGSHPHVAIFMERKDFSSDDAYNNYVEKRRLYIIFQKRLEDYKRYLAIKAKIREKRYESQTLLEPNNGEVERFKSS